MRRLMWFAIGYAMACALGAYLIRQGLLLWVCLGIAGAIGCFLLRKDPLARRAAVVFVGFCIGCGVFHCYDIIHIAPARLADGRIQEIRLRADSYGWETDYGCCVDGTIELEGRNYRMRLYLDENIPITPGDEILVEAKLRLTDEGGTREPTFHRSNGILLLGYQREELTILQGTPTWRDYPGILRQKAAHLLETHISGEAAEFIKALLLGDRTGLSYQRSTDFKVTGTSHIVAVSGLHVSILFSLVYLAAGKNRVLTALLGIPCVMLFAAVAGFTPSVTRAAIMQILMMLSLLCLREYDPPTALSFAALAMLVWNPLVITSAGFQLSVGSVAGIYLYSSRIRGWILERLPGKGKGKRMVARVCGWLSGSIGVSLSAISLTTPLVAVYFHTVSLIGIVANLLVLPLISSVFYGSMAVCLLGLVWPGLASFAGGVLACIIHLIFGIVEILAKIPLAAVYSHSDYIAIWLVFCYVLQGWLIATKQKRPLVTVLLGVLGLCAALSASLAEPLMDDYRVTALDVGQGQCILLQSEGCTYMVDCGGDYDADAADSAVEYLLSQGISRLDGLILTHYDRDHAGGVPLLAYRIDIDRIFLPQTDDTDGLLPQILESTAETQQIIVTEDLRITFGEAAIQIFAPETGDSGNESCAAVLFCRENCDTLITGDMSAFRERQLLTRTELPDLEVLIVGHHGSNTSTSPELLRVTAPDVAMISVGADNSYGHPTQRVLDRLAEFGCAVYRTDQMGDLIYRR